jgi:DNA-binding transcriptional MerR regulator
MQKIRKRDAYTRARAKRTRPQTPAPQTGWRIRELAHLAQVSVRTLRSYVAMGLLTPTEFRGTATRYQRGELVRLLAVLQGRKDTKLTLSEIKQRLEAWGDAELEAWIRTLRLPPLAAAALGITQSAAPQAAAASEAPPLENWLPQLQAYQRIQLIPGLELSLSALASPAALRAARELCEKYLG